VVARGCDHRVGRTPRDRCRRCPTTYPRLAPERCAARQFRKQTTATRAIGPRSVRRMGQGDKETRRELLCIAGFMARCRAACMADEGGCAAGRRSVTVTTESRAPSSPSLSTRWLHSLPWRNWTVSARPACSSTGPPVAQCPPQPMTTVMPCDATGSRPTLSDPLAGDRRRGAPGVRVRAGPGPLRVPVMAGETNTFGLVGNRVPGHRSGERDRA